MWKPNANLMSKCYLKRELRIPTDSTQSLILTQAHLSVVEVHGEEPAGNLLEILPVLPAVAGLVLVEGLEVVDGLVDGVELLELVAAHGGAQATPGAEHPHSTARGGGSQYRANRWWEDSLGWMENVFSQAKWVI